MNKCGKSFLPECEYFTTGGCISPFNCPYKTEHESITTATSTPLNSNVIYTYETYKDKEIARLTAENEQLRARLENAIELPAIVMIERTLVNGKFKHTQKAQAFNGRIGVVYSDKTRWGGLLVDICSEKTFDYEPAKARLAEIKAEAKLKEIGGAQE